MGTLLLIVVFVCYTWWKLTLCPALQRRAGTAWPAVLAAVPAAHTSSSPFPPLLPLPPPLQFPRCLLPHRFALPADQTL